MIQDVAACIKKASQEGPIQSLDIDGLSGQKVLGTLQRLAQLKVTPDSCYVEIGVFRGLTLLSVASVVGEAPVYGIDNFAQFDPKGENRGVVESRINELGLKNANLINADYEDALDALPKYIGDQKMGLYWVDGPHDYRSQLVCLLMALPHLADGAVIMIDDCNYRHVRQANSDFLKAFPEWALMFEAYTPCHPNNMTPQERQEAEGGWWNGINILVHDPGQTLERLFPPTERSRLSYENEHIVHSARFASHSQDAVELLSTIYGGQEDQITAHFRHVWGKLRAIPQGSIPEFSALNTFTRDIPQERMANPR